MARRDQLTYDLGQPSRRPLPWLPLLLVVAVLGLAALLVQGALSSHRVSPAAPQPGVVTSPTPTPRASDSPPLPAGSDAQEGPGLPEGSRQAASRFVQAWLDRNPATRESALHQVSTPALAEALMLTDPANVPRARPRGAPVLEDAGTYSAQFSQPLSTGATVSIYLVADPAARYRWLATSVEQA
ncbi:MAG: hypothetical protein ACJ72K_11575 [Friedmanniella sp.]